MLNLKKKWFASRKVVIRNVQKSCPQSSKKFFGIQFLLIASSLNSTFWANFKAIVSFAMGFP